MRLLCGRCDCYQQQGKAGKSGEPRLHLEMVPSRGSPIGIFAVCREFKERNAGAANFIVSNIVYYVSGDFLNGDFPSVSDV
jgi:hypothetical protein